jgi:hypothetical protein
MQQAHSSKVLARTVAPPRYETNIERSSGGLFLKYGINYNKNLLTAITCSLSCFLSIGSADASPLVNVTFSGDNGQFASYYGEIANDLNDAAGDWEKLFVSGTASALNLDVVFDNSPTANSSSLFATPLYSIGPISVFQQGAVDAVLNGVHNPQGPYDAEIHIGTSYLTNELWFDPDLENVDSVPVSKTDAESVFLHEFGHIFGFQGYRDQSTGTLSSNDESTFDTWVISLDNVAYFTGFNAEDLFGGPVPLTIGNIYHIGNPSGPGADLEDYPGDLMNGNVLLPGREIRHFTARRCDFCGFGAYYEWRRWVTCDEFCRFAACEPNS